MLLLVGLMLYVLSVGPTWWLQCRKGGIRWLGMAIEYGCLPIWFV